MSEGREGRGHGAGGCTRQATELGHGKRPVPPQPSTTPPARHPQPTPGTLSPRPASLGSGVSSPTSSCSNRCARSRAWASRGLWKEERAAGLVLSFSQINNKRSQASSLRFNRISSTNAAILYKSPVYFFPSFLSSVLPEFPIKSMY